VNGNIVVAWESRRETQEALFGQRALLGRDLAVVCAIDPLPLRGTLRPLRGATGELVTRRRESLAAAAIEAWADRLRAEGVDVEASLRRGDAARVLLDEAARRGSATIAIAARPPPAVYGSTLATLVRHAPVPVLVVRESRRPDGRPQRLVVPLDLRAGVERVLPPTLELAQAHDAEVVLVALGAPVSAKVRAAVDEAERTLASGGAATRLHLAGEVPLRRLSAELEAQAPDLIVVATQPRSSSSIAGATSERVISQLLLESSSSLLVVGDQPQRSGVAATRRRERGEPARTHVTQEVRS
jgi:nucleotide-binding universal stress UspA family protein